MNSYIGSVRRRESGFLVKLSRHASKIKNRFKRHDPMPSNLSDDKMHIEEKQDGFIKRLFKGKTEDEKKEIVEEIRNEPEPVIEKMKEIKEDYDTFEEVEEEVEHKKEGLFSKFKKLLKSKRKEEDEDVPVEQVEAVMHGHHASDAVHHEPTNETPKVTKVYEEVTDIHEAKDDLKKMSKLMLHIMQSLPKEEQHKIRESEEFHEYRELLDKYGFVR